MINSTESVKRERIKVLFVLIFIFINTILSAQEIQFDYYYRVYFRDKGDNDPSHYIPSRLLSERAISRRISAGIDVPDYRDIPVYYEYLTGVAELGLKLHCKSKWMNTGLFKTQQPIDQATLLALPYVADIKLVKNPTVKSSHSDKLDFQVYQEDPAAYDRPITMLNGSLLHSSGLDGNGILIAVIDGGFLNADLITSLNHLRDRNGIKGTYDFVNNDPYVYDYHNHGTAVLSVLAGKITGTIEGTAPGADFLLLRTEDTGSEFSVEEDFWTAGAEYADSAGADIISSSVGYYIFDDHTMDYQYKDLDGDRTFVTQVADIAASKGILVVASAGNERNQTWKRIVAPSDGDSVVAVGAVDGTNLISYFSSAGPSADGRIKPDNTAMGVYVPVQTELSITGRSSGTSFSCPVLSGMTACLMQAVPGVRNTEIIDALHKSADRYTAPDSLYGYGTPDMLKALEILQDLKIKKPDGGTIAWPNPTKGDVEIYFSEPPGRIKIEIFNSLGRIFFRKEFPEYAGRTLPVYVLQNEKAGIYFIRIITETGTFTHKIIRLND
jgi:serine protease AprX